MKYSKTANDIIRYVVKYSDNNKEVLMIEVLGKKRALKALNLPVDLPRARPEESRWGKVISIEEAREQNLI